MSVKTVVRNILLLGGPLSLYLFWQSVASNAPGTASAGFACLALALVGSVIPVHMRWGKFGTWWFVVAYPDKHMPVFVFFRSAITTLVFTVATGYAEATGVTLPGFAWLNAWYFYLSVLLGVITIGCLVAYARAYPAWMSTLDYLSGRNG